MNFLITKYSGSSNIGINYFVPVDLTVEDYINIGNLPSDSFPSFTDEMTRDNNKIFFVGGDYDAVVSMRDTTLSNLGLSIRDFFSITEKQVLRIIVEISGVQKMVGFIDNGSFDFDYNYNKPDGLYLKFTVYSAETELIKAMKNKSYKQFADVYSNSFEGQNPYQFLGNLSSYFQMQFILHPLITAGIVSRCSPLHKMFYNKGCDEVFVALCKGFGLLFKILPNNCSISQWNFLEFRIFTRQTGIDESDPIEITKCITHNEGRLAQDDNYRFYGVPQVKITSGAFTEGDNFKGVVCAGIAENSGFEYVTIAFYGPVTETFKFLWVFTTPTGFPFGIWDITGKVNFLLIDIDMTVKDLTVLKRNNRDTIQQWDEGNNITDLAFGRCFVKSYTLQYFALGKGWRVVYDDDGADLVAKEFITSETYSYLIANFEKVKKFTIPMTFDFTFLAFNKAIVEGEKYTVERVFDINTNVREYKAEMFKQLT